MPFINIIDVLPEETYAPGDDHDGDGRFWASIGGSDGIPALPLEHDRHRGGLAGKPPTHEALR